MSQPCLPVSHKRKRKQDEDKNEEEDVTFDNLDGLDGVEYLSRVVKQASKLPEVFVANDSNYNSQTEQEGSSVKNRPVPIDGSAASLAYLVSHKVSLTPPPSKAYLPQNELWMQSTLDNFQKLRDYLENCKDQGIGGKMTERIPMPPMKERSGWHIFCVGRDEAMGNTGSYFGGEDDIEEVTDNKGEKNGDVPEWKQNIPSAGYDPDVKIVLQMDQVLVRRVLSHLCHYVSEGWSPATEKKCAWLYSLLAKLEKPVHRDDAASLYSLLKRLTQERASIGQDKRVQLARLNTLIVIVVKYFQQGDGKVLESPTS